ncbi:MAG: DUF222 domain-containing protein [Microbacterium sp.]|uniref:HNH endonuclease signature motif containing protein n=1 Tax=Microbacterium sp. TaxID=51671 RepID=UPI0039E6CD2F
MHFLTGIHERVEALCAHRRLDVEAGGLVDAMRRLSGDELLAILAQASDIKNALERLVSVGAGVVAERSARGLGHTGLAATRGHATPTSLVQSILGGTRADAGRAVRAGQSLLEAGSGDEGSEAMRDEPAEQSWATPWHEPLDAALLAGELTVAAHDAITRGLGQPPTRAAGGSLEDGGGLGDDADTAIREVWRIAAAQLLAEATAFTVEELFRRARQVCDALDPVGVEERFAKRYEARSWRMWTDRDGGKHARIDFDDEMGEFVEDMIGAAPRPRRGGPRFVSDEERAAADALVEDPRTNDQLAYDLVVDVLRAGALANASDVFGSRQPGVRMVAVKGLVGPRDGRGRLLATASLESGGATLPGSVLERALCDLGSVDVTVDSCGNPLDVGREQRLFTPKQRLALAIRDGGCLWPGCDRPPAYCEAHHIDHFAEGGRTDGDRGILLCRYHHMALHHGGWRITRDGLGPFLLHQPGNADDPIVLRSRSPLRWAWDPPPERPGWRHPVAPAA